MLGVNITSPIRFLSSPPLPMRKSSGCALVLGTSQYPIYSRYCTGYVPEEYGSLTCVQVGNRMGREEREKTENRRNLPVSGRLRRRMGRDSIRF